MKSKYNLYRTYRINLGGGIFGCNTYKIKCGEQSNLVYGGVSKITTELFCTHPNLNSILFVGENK